MDKFLVIDVETSGFTKGDDVARNHQIVSIGMIVADDEFKPIEKFYAEIQWNGTSHWDTRAERIHGLSKQYLNENGLTEEDAVVEIMTFITKHYDIDESIYVIGHNSAGFDIPFIKKLLRKYDMDLKFAHRKIDTFSIGMVCLGAKDSNELFSIFYPKRTVHNSLSDAEMCLGVCRKIRKLFRNIIND